MISSHNYYFLPSCRGSSSRRGGIRRSLLLHGLVFCESQSDPLCHFDVTSGTILNAGGFGSVQRLAAERKHTLIKALFD
jgi:hypothetical protein